MNKWIDVHTHLQMLEMSPKDAIEAGKLVGVEKFITIGTSPDDHDEILRLAESYDENVYCTLGVHPHDASQFNDSVSQYLLKHVNHPRLVAIGEIGLDFYYNESPQDVQMDAFRKQLKLADDYGLPVEIHSRDAEKETIQILEEFNGRIKGLMHCFTGSQWLCDSALKLGLDISISGVVTFKNAESLRATVKTVPLERLHVETDAPFLAPVPMRGKKNQPSFVLYTAQEVAKIKEIDLEILSNQTRMNALKLFNRIKW